MPKYKIMNKTKQDGVVKIHGDWVLLHPGDFRILDEYPVSYTHGLSIVKIVSGNDVHYIKQPKTSGTKTVVTVDKTEKKQGGN